MKIVVRPARKGEGGQILTIHRRAIHEIACADYPEAILNAWGAPIVQADLLRQSAAFDEKLEDDRILLMAEVDGILAGFGESVPARCELVAVYVNPDFKRRGVGKALLGELERIAKEKGVPYLQMDSSLTAEPFYMANGYSVIERGFHTLRNSQKMACVKMKKNLG